MLSLLGGLLLLAPAAQDVRTARAEVAMNGFSRSGLGSTQQSTGLGVQLVGLLTGLIAAGLIWVGVEGLFGKRR